MQPISLPQATALAKLQENKINDRRRNYKPSPFPSPISLPSSALSGSPRPKAPFVQRTPDKMAFRREKGLCYNCEDKWSSTHHCKGGVFLFIADPDHPDLSLNSLTSETTTPFIDHHTTLDPTPPTSHISLNALSGLLALETFRVYGFINHARLTILIDIGSTHNFIQPCVAKFLNLPTKDTSPLREMVGNGYFLDCRQLCHVIALQIQHHTFTVTLHMFPLVESMSFWELNGLSI